MYPLGFKSERGTTDGNLGMSEEKLILPQSSFILSVVLQRKLSAVGGNSQSDFGHFREQLHLN